MLFLKGTTFGATVRGLVGGQLNIKQLIQQPRCGLIVKSPQTQESTLVKKGWRGEDGCPMCQLWLSEVSEVNHWVGEGANPVLATDITLKKGFRLKTIRPPLREKFNIFIGNPFLRGAFF